MPHPDESLGLSIAATQLALLTALGPVVSPSIVVGANPSASVGLAAVNGSAITYMRSDAAPALDVTISPTWTGAHVFDRGAASANVMAWSSNDAQGPYATMRRSGTPFADFGNSGSNLLVVGAVLDGFAIVPRGAAKPVIFANNNGNNIIASMNSTAIALGNATDNTSFTFVGASVPKHGGAQLLQTSAALTNNAAAAAGTLTNAPVAGNPTKWIPINDNGTIRNIPAW